MQENNIFIFIIMVVLTIFILIKTNGVFENIVDSSIDIKMKEKELKEVK